MGDDSECECGRRKRIESTQGRLSIQIDVDCIQAGAGS